MRRNDEYDEKERNISLYGMEGGGEWGKQKGRRHEERRRQGAWEGLCVLKRKIMDRERERESEREKAQWLVGNL